MNMFTREFQSQLVPITDQVIDELIAAVCPGRSSAKAEIQAVIAELVKDGEQVRYSPATHSIVTLPVFEWYAPERDGCEA